MGDYIQVGLIMTLPRSERTRGERERTGSEIEKGGRELVGATATTPPNDQKPNSPTKATVVAVGGTARDPSNEENVFIITIKQTFLVNIIYRRRQHITTCTIYFWSLMLFCPSVVFFPFLTPSFPAYLPSPSFLPLLCAISRRGRPTDCLRGLEQGKF